jgi:hypothetical protein|tara:strand:- start:549 stop:767 length:219 start_codon:yes stop_codon:yes gene_type:complete
VAHETREVRALLLVREQRAVLARDEPVRVRVGDDALAAVLEPQRDVVSDDVEAASKGVVRGGVERRRRGVER